MRGKATFENGNCMAKKRKIAITIGDPAGIGTEVVLKALLDESVINECNPLIIGDRMVIQEAVEKMNIPFEIGAYDILDLKLINNRKFQKSVPTKQGGIASVSYIKKAVDFAYANIVEAVATAPISKESLKMAGYSWPGHTEMLADFTNTKDFAMMLCGGSLRVILATIHTAIKDVPQLITKEKVLKTIILAEKACNLLAIKEPKIGVAALNPHAGESGIFGLEEIQHITPAVKEANKMGIPASGPFAADALFWKAYNGEYDIVVCMYHDQGLIPLKMIAFDKGVNVTVGLPIIRTSPDHGTAYDIAWKGLADPSSMIEAIKFASQMVGNRQV
jgi:4-hydroxythreonine-4-phosphate dehydrogenase